MRPKLKGIDCPGVDLATWYPDTLDNFGIHVTLSIGAEDEPGQELFYITVCTPKWLLQEKGKDSAIFGSGYVIMFDWDYERLVNLINYRFAHMNRDTWSELAAMLQRRLGMYWEFDNYVEYEP